MDELLARAHAARVRVVAGAAVLAAALAGAHALSLHEHLPPMLEASRGLGARGILAHLAAYLAAALLGLPLSPVTVAAGATYGALAGWAVAAPGVAAASTVAFLVGRVVTRDPEALASGESRLARAARAVGRGGFRLVLALRLAPAFPFSILNFAFGATPTPLSHFALATFLGALPSQLGYACLGAVLAWPPGRGRTLAEVALVAAGVLASLAALAGAVTILRRSGEPAPTADGNPAPPAPAGGAGQAG